LINATFSIKTTRKNALQIFFGSTKQRYPVFALKRLKHHNEVMLLTSANYATTFCLPIACQSQGLKWLLIFCNPED